MLLGKRRGGSESENARSLLLLDVSERRVPLTRRMVGARHVKTCFSKEPREKPSRLPLKRWCKWWKSFDCGMKKESWFRMDRFRISPSSGRGVTNGRPVLFVLVDASGDDR